MDIQQPKTFCINLCEAVGYAKEDWRTLKQIIDATGAKAGIDRFDRV